MGTAPGAIYDSYGNPPGPNGISVPGGSTVMIRCGLIGIGTLSGSFSGFVLLSSVGMGVPFYGTTS
jgi:hypothetical protein